MRRSIVSSAAPVTSGEPSIPPATKPHIVAKLGTNTREACVCSNTVPIVLAIAVNTSLTFVGPAGPACTTTRPPGRRRERKSW